MSGTAGSTDHSIIFVEIPPCAFLVLTSISSPPSVSSATVDSGRPPTLKDSLTTRCNNSRMLVYRNPGVATASGSDICRATSGSIMVALCRRPRLLFLPVRKTPSMPLVKLSHSSTAVRKEAVWGDTSRWGVELVDWTMRCLGVGPASHSAELVRGRFVRRKKMLFPSSGRPGRRLSGERGDGDSMLSSSLCGVGVSGTCMFRSYACTTLSAASTARRELSVIGVIDPADPPWDDSLTLHDLDIIPQRLEDLPDPGVGLSFQGLLHGGVHHIQHADDALHRRAELM